MAKKWGGRRSQKLRELVFALKGKSCYNCGQEATTVEHLTPRSKGGTDDLDNLVPACSTCNARRQDRAGMGNGAHVVVVTGPPASGKSTWVLDRARRNDVVIDLDRIAHALMGDNGSDSHGYPAHIRHIAIGARREAIKRATRLVERVTVYIIHAVPTPEALADYQAMRWEIVTIDPGRDVVLDRIRRARPVAQLEIAERWYATQYASQETADSGLAHSRKW